MKEKEMKLEENEYTTESFLELLTEKFGLKITGEPFTANDVAQYLIRGYTPYRYGYIKISATVEKGVRIIKVITEVKLEEVSKSVKKKK